MTNRHLEIPAEDIERAKKFYTELFGWKVQKAEGPMEYWLIATTDEKGEEGVGGGMMRRQDRKIEILGPVTNAATTLLRR